MSRALIYNKKLTLTLFDNKLLLKIVAYVAIPVFVIIMWNGKPVHSAFHIIITNSGLIAKHFIMNGIILFN